MTDGAVEKFIKFENKDEESESLHNYLESLLGTVEDVKNLTSIQLKELLKSAFIKGYAKAISNIDNSNLKDINVAIFNSLLFEAYEFTSYLINWIINEPDFFHNEMSEDICNILSKCGLSERVNYDPTVHGELEYEEGQEIWLIDGNKFIVQ